MAAESPGAPLRSDAGIEIRALRFTLAAVRACFRALRFVPAVAVVSTIGAWFFVRGTLAWNADGDQALHLALIRQIASTHHLPASLPHLPARVAEGGTVEASFPYAYTPLYHATGALMYTILGVNGVLMINAISAAVIGYVIFAFARRRTPWPVAIIAASAAFISPHVQGPFAGIFMEPMELALLFAGAWLVYVALASRGVQVAVVAGAVLGLSIGTRQSALMYVAVLGMVTLSILYTRGALRGAGLRRELPWLFALCLSTALVAAPSLLFLASHNGGIGYADLTIPGTGSGPHVDPSANAYIASISKPSAPISVWMNRYSRTLLYGSDSFPAWLQLFLLLPAVAGVAHLETRRGAGRFLARWIAFEIVAEIGMYLTLHGNSRYIILSQMLFFTATTVGAYAIARRAVLASAGRPLRGLAYSLGIVGLFVGMGFAVFPPGYFDQYTGWLDRDYRAFRGETYADMGAWVNVNTPPDSLILVPRTYTALLTWDRDVTWVTFYGNAWVVDAISTPDPAEANRILTNHGVDYVLIPDPPGSYVDRMPADGMRSFLQLGAPATPYFTLAYVTQRDEPYEYGSHSIANGLRLYRVNAATQAR
jgi:hypothetical protein